MTDETLKLPQNNSIKQNALMLYTRLSGMVVSHFTKSQSADPKMNKLVMEVDVSKRRHRPN